MAQPPRLVFKISIVTFIVECVLIAGLLWGINLPFFAKVKESSKTLSFAAIMPFILINISRLVEGWSFITFPSIICAILIAFGAQSQGALALFIASLATVFAILHGIALVILPSRLLVEPKGKFEVGYRRHKDKGLNFCVFYPTLKASSDRPKWLAEEESRLKYFEISQFPSKVVPQWVHNIMTDFCTKVDLPAGVNSVMLPKENLNELTQQKGFIPIIFSHGLGGNLHSYSGFVTQLASQGHVVFCLDHLDEVFEIRFKKDAQEKHLAKRFQEVRELLTCIHKKPNLINKIFDTEIKLDLDKTIIMGHSYGGLTAYQVASEDDRVKSCIMIDPWLTPADKTKLNKKLNCNVLLLESGDWNERYIGGELTERNMKVVEAQKGGSKGALYCKIPNSQHNHFSDDPFMIGGLMQRLKIISDLKVCAEIYEMSIKILDDYISITSARESNDNEANLKDFVNLYSEDVRFPVRRF